MQHSWLVLIAQRRGSVQGSAILLGIVMCSCLVELSQAWLIASCSEKLQPHSSGSVPLVGLKKLLWGVTILLGIVQKQLKNVTVEARSSKSASPACICHHH